MLPTSYHLSVTEKDSKNRLDKFLVNHLSELSRSRIQSLITEGHITQNGITITNPSHKVRKGEEYRVVIPPAEPTDMKATEIELDIVYEDEYLLVINKPAGMTVHPGAGNYHDTLANALLAYCGDSLSGIGGVERPGIVHRLDKDTSGLLVVAKTDQAHRHLSEQLSKRTLKRIYYAICWGEITPRAGTIIANIGRSPSNRKKMAIMRTGGREAITHYKTLEIFGESIASLVECRLETGRTHQIRLHLTHEGHSLIGDKTYGNNKRKKLGTLPDDTVEIIENFSRQALHARHIGFIHPATEASMQFEAPIPEDMLLLLNSLKEI